MDNFSWLVENWDTIIASALVIIASAGKVTQMALKTVRDIMDAWTETFYPKPKF
jgi:hypothetical protein